MAVSHWPDALRRPWMAWAVVLALLTAIASAFAVLWRTDGMIYDGLASDSPAPPDIVIVAIDDASIAALGRWPWRRELHAALLDRLHAQGARAVALDVLLTEPENDAPHDDQALAEAMRRGPPTVLPLLVQSTADGRMIEALPVPVLREAAAAVAHVDLELDRDGIVRSIYLREGAGVPNRWQLAAALLAAADGEAAVAPLGDRAPVSGDEPARPARWERDYHYLIPFRGGPGHFTTLSYVDVLRGSYPDSALRGKLVLVGATAAGLGDAWVTPRSGQSRAMSGVEISANILAGLRSHQLIRPLGPITRATISLLIVLLVGVGLSMLSPRRTMIFAAAVWLATLGASVFALRAGYWWPPGATLLALLLLYPLWSWRRLAVTQRFLDEELQRMAPEPISWWRRSALDRPRTHVDPLERRMDLVRQASRDVSDARRVVVGAIRALPDAVVIVDNAGCIVLANPAVARLFAAPLESLEGAALDAHLAVRSAAPEARFAALAASAPSTVEVRLRPRGTRAVTETPGEPVVDELHFLLRSEPFLDGEMTRVGTLVELTDITAMRLAQREREDVIRFLSHDMKSPASSLLGLAQLQRDATRALPPAALSQRLDLLAQRLITLVDSFVALARAESADPRVFVELDLRDALQDAYDEVWATAEARSQSLLSEMPREPVVVQGDRALLARAIANLLGNASKFAPEGSPITLECLLRSDEAVIRVGDRGPGIEPDRIATLFHRFSRRGHRGPVDPGGAGLGLAFVRVVAQKHGGRAWVEPADTGAMVCFSVALDASDSANTSLQ